LDYEQLTFHAIHWLKLANRLRRSGGSDRLARRAGENFRTLMGASADWLESHPR
jgi:hypothetical protein